MPFDDRELLARLIQCEAGGEGEASSEESAKRAAAQIYRISLCSLGNSPAP